MQRSVRSSARHAALDRLRRHRLARFILVGMVNTLFGYGVFAALVLLTKRSELSLVAATVLGAGFNFFTTGRLVFGNQGWGLLARFILGYGASLLLNVVLLKVLVRMGIHPLLAQATCLPFIVLITYMINARLVFTRRANGQGAGSGTA